MLAGRGSHCYRSAFHYLSSTDFAQSVPYTLSKDYLGAEHGADPLVGALQERYLERHRVSNDVCICLT